MQIEITIIFFAKEVLRRGYLRQHCYWIKKVICMELSKVVYNIENEIKYRKWEQTVKIGESLWAQKIWCVQEN